MRLEHKLRSPWIKGNGFLLEYDKALEAAKASGKPVFAYFTRSYVDDPLCDEVEKAVLPTPEFKAFGEGVVLFLHVSSGFDGAHADLLRAKGGSGVPAFLVLDAGGSVLAHAAPPHGVPAFEKALKSGLAFEALRNKADKTADEKVQVVAADMDLGNLRLPRAPERIAELGDLTPSQKKVIDDATLRLEIRTAATGAAGSRERSRAAGRKFAEWWAAGREPSTDEHVDSFFRLILDHAEGEKDAGLFRRALEKLRGRFAEKPGWKAFEERQAGRLRELEKAAPRTPEKSPPADGK
jgi:hypothetical protein